ncbi:MAG: porin family protein [Candidatus Aminicenantes bacterium]|nr:porin family protein [Candidatus Aminicenantes bacterium]
MGKKLFIPAVLLVFMFSVPQAFGQLGIYGGPFGGFSFQHPQLPDVDFEADGAFVYGAKLGLRILMFGIEGQYFRAVHDISLKELALLDWDGQTVDYSYYGLNLKIYFPLLILHPYVTAGFGYYTADISEIGDDGKAGYNFGGGVELKLGKKMSLGAEGKWHQVTLDVDIFHPNLSVGDFTLTAGLNVHF